MIFDTTEADRLSCSLRYAATLDLAEYPDAVRDAFRWAADYIEATAPIVERESELRCLAKEVRDAQREFYDPKRKTGSSLGRAKSLEKRLDKFIVECEREPGLFD